MDGAQSSMSDRAARRRDFVVGAGWGDAEERLLAGDASFRKYFRLTRSNGSAVVMDAPAPQEDVRPFVRIGKHVMVGGMSGVEHDVIPYGSVTGNRAHLSGLNLIGLKRRGFGRDDIHKLRTAYRLLFAQEGTLQERLEDVSQLFPDSELVQEVVAFTRESSQRGICQPKPDVEAA